jgi:mannosyltransferase OCH1-like enzyme
MKYYPDDIHRVNNLPQIIYQVDFIRYYVVHQFGGFYTDMDTRCLKSLEVLRKQYPNATAILGLESDYTNTTRRAPTNRKLQITQYAFAFAAKSDLLMYTIKCIWRRLDTLSEEQLKKGDAAELTGPGTWTDCIEKYMEEKGYVKSYRDEVRLTVKPKLFGDILILPVVSFNPDFYLDNPGAGPSDHEYAYIKHLYEGSWKPTDSNGPNSVLWWILILSIITVILIFILILLKLRKLHLFHYIISKNNLS